MEITKMNNIKCISQYIITDVTAVKFVEKYIIAGIGGHIHVFDVQTRIFLCKEEVFEGQRVHNIFNGKNEYIAIVGGCKIQLFKIAGGDEFKLSKQLAWSVDDWIQYLHWLDCGNVALITAHNVISLWNSKTGEKLKNIFCEEKCILYCAFLSGSTWDKLLVFSGTVFQQVLVWAPDSLENDTVDCPVLHVLEGHHGVIFSISYDSCSQHICTTSDDRSVRIWFVEVQLDDDSDYLAQWKKAKISLLHILYGHTSRVWRNIIINNMVISVGEDSRLCMWNMDGSLQKCLKTHQNGSVWSVDYNKKMNLIVTGGGDGGISLWALNTDSHVAVSLPFQENLFPKDGTNIAKEQMNNFPRRICLTNKGNIVAITDSGSLLHYTVMGSEHEEWSLVYQDDKLANYCLLEISPCKQYIALGTIDGHILIFVEDMSSQRKLLLLSSKEKAVAGRIFSLHWLSSEIILSCGPHGILEMWKLGISYHLTKIHEFELPKCKEQWTSAALLKANFLLCGDRIGSIHLFNLNSNQRNSMQCPCQSFNKIHGHLGVSSLVQFGNHIYSTGRDGILRHYVLLENEGRLECLNADKVQMEWPATVVLSAFGLLVLGFKAVNFVIWSYTERRTLLNIPCGGGHRSWDWKLEGNSFNLIYVKDKLVHLYTCMMYNPVKPTIQRGFHTKQVCSIKQVPLLRKDSDGGFIFVSASEDATVRVITFDSSSVLQTLAVAQSHISSVRTVAVCPLPENVLIFSGGGRAQLKVWRLSTSKIQECPFEVVCQELYSHMLRDSGNRNKKPWLSMEYQTDDPETRYMDLCATVIHCQETSSETHPHQKGSKVLLVAGCSDSFLRIFSFDTIPNELKLVGEYSFHKQCVLRVSLVKTKSLRHVAVTMATDGKMAFWDMTNCIEQPIDSTHKQSVSKQAASTSKNDDILEMNPFSVFELHQSGINSFDWLHLQDDTFLFATGGDDNAIVLSVIKIISATSEKKMQAQIILQWRNDNAHTSQITGLEIKDSVLISTGIDQHIKIWNLNCELESHTLSASIVSDYCSAVPDIQGLLTWKASYDVTVCVYGKGLEIVNLQLNSDTT